MLKGPKSRSLPAYSSSSIRGESTARDSGCHGLMMLMPMGEKSATLRVTMVTIDEGAYGDESVAFRTRIGHVKMGAAKDDGFVDEHGSVREFRQP